MSLRDRRGRVITLSERLGGGEKTPFESRTTPPLDKDDGRR